MKKVLLVSIALASFTASAANAQETIHWSAPAVSAQTGQHAYFPMGTALQLTTRTELNTKYSHAGDRFYLEVAEPLIYRGQVVVPVGAIAVGEVMRAEGNGHFGKKGKLDVRLLYVQTPSGTVRLSGRNGRTGTGQGLLSIGGAALIAWPMLFIHGTSGKLPADTAMTAYLADELPFQLQNAVSRTASAVAPGDGDDVVGAIPARFDQAVVSDNRR